MSRVMSPEPVSAELTLLWDEPQSLIHPNLHGHFAEHLGRCIYDGIWVGEDSPIPHTRGIRRDVAQALRRLGVPVLRWPGGCFADEYHWRDGIGPREERPRRINTHWGGVVESNHFGTHEFLDLCEQIGAEPYVCANVGSGTVNEMMEWVEYLTADADSSLANLRRRNGREAPWKLRYLGIGNESWGCGGQMRPEFYADHYRRYAAFVKNHGTERIERIACGSSGTDFDWTEVLMRRAGKQMDGLSLHWYSLPTRNWQLKGSSTEFGEEEWHSTLVETVRMDELVTSHSALMDQYDPERRVSLVVDEWGTWYDVEPGTHPGFLYQQNTLRDAVAAALNLNIFHRHSARVRMANLAQTVNVLQALILTEREKMVLTPTYHVFEMYRVHRGATLIPVRLEAPEYRLGEASLPMLDASASRDGAGRTHLSVVNLDPVRPASVLLRGMSGDVTGRVLTADRMNAHNTFENSDVLKPQPFCGASREGDVTRLELPPKSVVVAGVR
jgi:alpha-L-arabinofuranosidase